MRWGNTLRTLALLTLLMPGLVLAAPTAGACGYCERGTPCATMAAPEPVAEAHSCCSGDPAAMPVEGTQAPVGAKACDCGREAPVAIVAVEAPTTDADYAEASIGAVVSAAVGVQVATRACDRHSTTPPSPLIFLLDCVFLT